MCYFRIQILLWNIKWWANSNIHYTVQQFGMVRLFTAFEEDYYAQYCLLLFSPKYSKNSNIVKYY